MIEISMIRDYWREINIGAAVSVLGVPVLDVSWYAEDQDIDDLTIDFRLGRFKFRILNLETKVTKT